MRKLRVSECYNLLVELPNFSIFRYLTEPERELLLETCEVLAFDKNEKVITQGEVGTCLYVLLYGKLNVTVTDNSGNEVILSTINKGDFFGESGIFYNARRTANVYPVQEEAVVLSFERQSLFEFIKTCPTAGVKILILFIKSLLNKINESNKELATTRGGNVLHQTQVDHLVDQILEQLRKTG